MIYIYDSLNRLINTDIIFTHAYYFYPCMLKFSVTNLFIKCGQNAYPLALERNEPVHTMVKANNLSSRALLSTWSVTSIHLLLWNHGKCHFPLLNVLKRPKILIDNWMELKLNGELNKSQIVQDFILQQIMAPAFQNCSEQDMKTTWSIQVFLGFIAMPLRS